VGQQPSASSLLKKSYFVLFLYFKLLLIKIILKYQDILNMKVRELCNIFFLLNEVSSMFLYECIIFNTYIFLHFEERFRESPGQKTKQFSVQTYNHSKLEQSFKLHFTFYIHYFLVYLFVKKLIRPKFQDIIYIIL
jgi:hypothetical protein